MSTQFLRNTAFGLFFFALVLISYRTIAVLIVCFSFNKCCLQGCADKMMNVSSRATFIILGVAVGVAELQV
jgi:hypothetical protein